MVTGIQQMRNVSNGYNLKHFTCALFLSVGYWTVHLVDGPEVKYHQEDKRNVEKHNIALARGQFAYFVPLKASCHWFLYIIPPGYSTSLTATRYDQATVIATIQVATMKNGHCLLVMRGKRSGITTFPNGSTVIRTRLWIKTFKETSPRKICILHKAWPRIPPIN